MSFESPNIVLRIEFGPGTKYAGFWAKVGVPTVAEFLAVRTDADLIGAMASHLVEWNLTADGEPVPATVEGVNRQSHHLVLSLANAWHRQILRTEKPEPVGGVGAAIPLAMDPPL